MKIDIKSPEDVRERWIEWLKKHDISPYNVESVEVEVNEIIVHTVRFGGYGEPEEERLVREKTVLPKLDILS